MKNFLNEFRLWWKYTKQTWKMGYEIYPLVFIVSIFKVFFSTFFMGTLSMIILLPFLNSQEEMVSLEKFEEYYIWILVGIVGFSLYSVFNPKISLFLKKKQEEMNFRIELFIKEKMIYIPYRYAIDDAVNYKVNRFFSGIRDIFEISSGQVNALGNLYTVIFASSIGIAIDPLFAGIVFLYIILSFIIDLLTARKNLEHRFESEEQYINNRARTLDYGTDFPSIHLLLSYQWSHFLNLYKQTSYAAIQRGLERTERNLKSDRLKSLLILFGGAVGLVYIYFQLQGGSMINIAATGFLLWKIAQNASVVSSFIIDQDSFKEQAKIFEEILMLSHKQKILERKKVFPDTTKGVTVSFRNVSFCYPGENEYIYKDFSGDFVFEQVFGLTGENGTGKTTLFMLITGLLEPVSGNIFINNIDVKNIQRAWFQENFAIYDTDMDLAEGVSVAEFLSTDKLLTLPKARQLGIIDFVIEQVGLVKKIPTTELETMIIGSQFPNGTGFSAGQEQRLLIARTLVSLCVGAKFVLIDEMTSNISYKDQKFFAELIKKNCKGGIIIAHNPTILDACDSILVCEDGNIFEEKNIIA